MVFGTEGCSAGRSRREGKKNNNDTHKRRGENEKQVAAGEKKRERQRGWQFEKEPRGREDLSLFISDKSNESSNRSATWLTTCRNACHLTENCFNVSFISTPQIQCLTAFFSFLWCSPLHLHTTTTTTITLFYLHCFISFTFLLVLLVSHLPYLPSLSVSFCLFPSIDSYHDHAPSVTC